MFKTGAQLPIVPRVTLGASFEQVLAAGRAGEASGLTALYRDLHAPLLRYLRSQEPAEAEDLASEVWLDVARGLGRFSGDEQDFRRWLFAIGRRRLIDLRRRRGRRRTEPVPAEHLERPSHDDVAGAVADAMSAAQAVARIAALLPPAQAEIVILRVVGGLGVDDVAAIVGKRPGTVRVIQHRALRRLAAELGPGAVTPWSSRAMS
jgi:RNA polymerase sigma-70 factor (ECF subfamily)